MSTTRFFVARQGDIDVVEKAAEEMRNNEDFVYLDVATTYQTIGLQTVLSSCQRSQYLRAI